MDDVGSRTVSSSPSTVVVTPSLQVTTQNPKRASEPLVQSPNVFTKITFHRQNLRQPYSSFRKSCAASDA